MPKYDKTKETRVWGVTVQVTDIRMTAGDSSGGTFTRLDNPLRGTLMWDQCMYVLHDVSVGGGAIGGSYTVTIQTDAITGETGLPIAQAASVGPNSATTIVMDNLHQSPASPLPTHIFVDQTAGGSTQGINFQCHAFAKQYRGFMGSPASNTSERVIQGYMIRGNSSTVDFSGDEGTSIDATFAIGTSGSNLGMNNMRLWDKALFWAINGNTEAGTHDVDIVGTIDGTTFTIATSGVGGALDTADEAVALANNFYGQSPNPSAIIWTEVNAGGVSDFRVVVLAKSGRGSLAKS